MLPFAVPWEQKLTWKRTGKVDKLLERLSNVVLILENDQRHGFDLHEIAGGMGAIYDGDRLLPGSVVPALQSWLYATRQLDVPHTLIESAISVVAENRMTHPVRDYLENLTWDKVQRLPTWLATYMGVKTDSVSARMGAWWLQQAAARGLTPGCQADYMVILEGAQGLGKSQALKALVPRPEWYTDSVSQFRDKDDKLLLAGHWLVELAELDALSRSSADHIKGVIVQQDDNVRPPYGKVTKRFPRGCVFAGTTNHKCHLVDETGGRRFWSVTVSTSPDLAAIARDRDQLWAEAVHRERRKVVRWVTSEDSAAFAEAADSRRVELPWEAQIAKWLVGRNACSTAEILDYLQVPIERHDNRTYRAVSAVMTALGWEQYKTTATRGYRRKT